MCAELHFNLEREDKIIIQKTTKAETVLLPHYVEILPIYTYCGRSTCLALEIESLQGFLFPESEEGANTPTIEEK